MVGLELPGVPSEPLLQAAFLSTAFALVGAMRNGGCDYLVRRLAMRHTARTGEGPKNVYQAFHAGASVAMLIPIEVVTGSAMRWCGITWRD